MSFTFNRIQGLLFTVLIFILAFIYVCNYFLLCYNL